MNAAVETVIALTDRVEAAIEAGDWPQAQQLEAERLRLLEQLALAHDASALHETYTALEARNHRLIGLVEQQKREVLREASVARAARHGAAAYSELEGAAEPSLA
jgi:hypothetical protein